MLITRRNAIAVSYFPQHAYICGRIFVVALIRALLRSLVGWILGRTRPIFEGFRQLTFHFPTNSILSSHFVPSAGRSLADLTTETWKLSCSPHGILILLSVALPQTSFTSPCGYDSLLSQLEVTKPHRQPSEKNSQREDGRAPRTRIR